MKKMYFGKPRKILPFLLVVLVCFTHYALAQIPVSGRVTSEEDGEGLPGVNVIIKGGSQGTVTDVDGAYRIEVPSTETVLVFSSVGFIADEITVGNQTVIDLALVPDITALQEIVVVGYGTQKKKDLTGSISTIGAGEFARIPATSPLQALSGRAAGLTITQTSGMPGAGSEVRIRGVQTLNNSDGNNKPIFVIDGIITDNIDNIAPNDIESVSVLKDASAAAIYGSRAANGVILVTTKRGKIPGKARITFDSYVGFQTQSNLKPELLNSEEYLEIFTEAYDNAGVDRPWSDADLVQYEGVNTDWKDLILRTGVLQNYNLGVAGSSEHSNYYISGTYQNHKGMVLSTDFERFTLRVNSDHNLNKWISFGNSLNVFTTESNGSTSVYRGALTTVPITRVYEDNGDWAYIRNQNLEGGGNPLFSAGRDQKTIKNYGLLGNLYLTLEPLEGLKFTTRGSAEWDQRNITNFNPSGDLTLGYGGGNVNSISKQHRQTLHTTVDFLLDYSTTISRNHNVTVLFGSSIEEWQRETLEGFRSSTPNNSIRYLTAGDPNTATNDNEFQDWAFLSFFGRINYNFKDKYLLGATIRYDGTSRLTEDNRWGTFPSVSAAWRISNEGFMDNVSFIDDLKLRASIGTLGNVQTLGLYSTVAALNNLPGAASQQIFPGYTFGDAVNPEIIWEETVKRGIGLNASLFNSKFSAAIDYYNENTHDLLFERPIPLSTGKTGEPFINGAEVKNTGIEIELGYSNTVKDWTYNLNFNFSANNNKVIDLAGAEEGFRTRGIAVGEPVSSFYGYKTNGIIKTQSVLDNNPYLEEANKDLGDIWWLDNDGDGELTADDRTIIGSVYPDFTYGLVGGVTYKNVGLQLQLQGVQGIDKDISTQNDFGLFHYFQRWAINHDDAILDRWHATKNPDGDMPRVDISDQARNRVLSDFWLKDASYLRIRNVNIYYNLPQRTLDNLNMGQLSVYFSVQNLYTFTSFIGNEVEFGEDRLKDVFPDTALPDDTDPFVGVPQPRTWTLGIKASF